jgi:hypothetical protein
MTMKVSEHQRRVLEHIAKNPSQRTTARVFYELCGSSKSVRSMFARGLVAGDSVPASYVSLTDVGRAALTHGEDDKR